MYDSTKYFANRGVERNKRPLQNIVYKVSISDLAKSKLSENEKIDKYGKYLFKNLGYLWLDWQYEKDYNKSPNSMISFGFITPDELKSKLGEKQWAKFCQGKREFIIQRRVDGKNIRRSKVEKSIK